MRTTTRTVITKNDLAAAELEGNICGLNHFASRLGHLIKRLSASGEMQLAEALLGMELSVLQKRIAKLKEEQARANKQYSFEKNAARLQIYT